MLDPSGLRDIDRVLLDLLNEGRVTPAYCRRWMVREEKDMHYSGGYVQERLARLVEHGHAVNLCDSGLYELVNDPRDDTEGDH